VRPAASRLAEGAPRIPSVRDPAAHAGGTTNASSANALLRIPLVAKIAGANGVVILAVLLACLASGLPVGERTYMLPIMLALGGSLVVSAGLVALALRPLADLETTAVRIRDGDLSARVPHSPLADASLRRVGAVINDLIDSVTSDRARLRELTTDVIRAGDNERAHIARELHDSTAQTLAALMLELSVLAAENRDVQLDGRIAHVRKIVGDVLDEVRALAHVVHPRVLDDLGLSAALRHLARETELRVTARIEVEGDAPDDALHASSAATLYRVAQEAVGNAVRHGRPDAITIRFDVRNGSAQVEVEDDGVGFSIEDAERRRPGMGLFTMRERTGLVGGHVEVYSTIGHGTRVVATVPTAPEAQSRPVGIATDEPDMRGEQ
jgi:signal transduction histidine kinase